MLHTTFDVVADALYLKLSDGVVARTDELDGWAYVDVDDHGRAVGIEVIHPARDWPLQEAIRRYGIEGDDRALLESMFPQASSRRVRSFAAPQVRLSGSAQTICVA